MGSQEVQYLEGLQIEYENATKQKSLEEKQKDLEASMTNGTKKEVDKIAKRMQNKKEIDTDEEAQALLLMLRNTKGVYNKADLQYIKQTLINSGYGALLEKPDAEEKTETKLKNKPYQISERGRTDGIGKADLIYEEIHDSKFADNKKVRNTLKEINPENAYSFFKSYQAKTGGSGMNKNVYGLSDAFSNINAASMAGPMSALLTQAKNMGLENTPAYRKLANVVNTYRGITKDKVTADPSKDSQVKADNAISVLLLEMGKKMVVESGTSMEA